MKLLPLIAILIPIAGLAASPKCASWPVNMGLVHLKNAGITDPAQINETKTQAMLIASEKVGKDRYRQVYDITYHERTGTAIEILTSSEECSLGGVDVYVVSKKITGQ